MQQHLSQQEQQRLDRRAGETEQRTGAQVVLAVVARSDVYAELPWKAFASGVAVSGAALFLADLVVSGWGGPLSSLLAVAAMLAAGAGGALLCILVPGFARMFLDAYRAEVEARQYAESMFLSRELFATSGRTGALIFVSLFERQVIILPDTGLRAALPADALQRIIGRMAPLLASGRVADAFEEGLAGLEAALPAGALPRRGGNELPDGIVQEGGA